MARDGILDAYRNSAVAGEFPYLQLDSKDGAVALLQLRANDLGDWEIVGAAGGVMTYEDGIPTDGISWRVNDNSGTTALKLHKDGTITMGRPLYDDFIIDPSGNVGINTGTFGTAAVNVFGIGIGTEPTDEPAGIIQMYAKDSSAGSADATLGLALETDPVVIGTFTESHKFPIWINSVEYHISLDAV